MALTEQIVWSLPPDLGGVEVLSVKNNQRPWCVIHHTYTVCNIDGFVSEAPGRRHGVAEWTYRRGIHQNPARTLMLLEPGEVHRNTKTPPPCNFSVVQIDPKLVNDAASELGLVPNPHLKEAVTADQRLYSAFVAFHASLDEETTSLNRQSLLTECIGALLANCCEETARPAATASRRSLVRARDFMAQHFPEKISLDQLAGVSELSRFHFLREFTREFGLSPHVYQTNLRISKARHLLKSGMHADDVAAKVGFSDQSHLIHHFKTAMGVTPGRYTTMISFHGKVQSR